MILKDAMLWRMIWKEYRAQRGFWLAIAGFGVVLMLLVMGLIDRQSDRIEALWVIAQLLSAVYALGCAAVLFASEREDGTTELLRIMAARTSRVFLGKVSFSLVSTVAMSILLLAAALILTWGSPVRLPGVKDVIAHQLLPTAALTAQLLAWGFLFSALCRKALMAVCLTAVTPLVCAIIYANVIDNPAAVRHWFAGLVLVIPLVAVSYILTRRTMAGRTMTQRTREWSLPRFVWRSALATSRLARLAAVKETAPAWRRMCTRLVWLEVRQAATIGHFLWIGAVYFLVFWPFSHVEDNPPRGLFGVLMVPLLLGVWTFQAESGRRIRFLADHGLSPRTVWLTKQLVWGLLAVTLTAPFIVEVEVGNRQLIQRYYHGSQSIVSSMFHKDVPGASAAIFAAVLACLGFGAGQFASMLIARGVTAGFVGFAMFAVLVPWSWLMIELGAPLSISVAPILVILIATTCGWSRHWLLERATWRSWLRLALGLGLSLVLVWGGVGAFRVFEVPRPDWIAQTLAPADLYGRSISPEEAKTADLYRRALAPLTWGAWAKESRDGVTKTALSGWEHVTDSERSLLADNQAALKLGLEATSREACAFHDSARPLTEWQQENQTFPDGLKLAHLILVSARELEADGKLDEALDRYLAVLRLARHMASRGTFGEWRDGASVETRVAEWMPIWAEHPNQTPERIEAGARRVEREISQFPPLRDAFLVQHFLHRRALLGDWSELLPKSQPPDDTWRRTALIAFERCCPWERTRALRLLDLVSASQLHSAESVEQALAVSGRDVAQWAERAGINEDNMLRSLGYVLRSPSGNFGTEELFHPTTANGNHVDAIPWKWVKSTVPLNTLVSRDGYEIWMSRLHRELSRRALALRLVLAAWKKAHGQYPEQLDELASAWPGMIIDPYTGAEFGYRPKGFPGDVRFSDRAIKGAVNIVQPGRAVFWSAGIGHARIIPLGRGENGVPAFQAADWSGPIAADDARPRPLAFVLP